MQFSIQSGDRGFVGVAQLHGRPKLQLLLANPRGFCAGVVRAIDALDAALSQFGPPIYVRHEIVHNPDVVDGFKARGAIFVDGLAEIPDGARVFLSAHGVAPAVRREAEERHLRVVDTTCPLVTKVHREAQRHAAHGRTLIVIGHAGHPEVEGIVGCLVGHSHHLVETEADARTLAVSLPCELAYVTQTTLSVGQTARIVAVLEERFPGIVGPARDDICYATTNRQKTVASLAPRCDAVIVVGGRHSSNSARLAETAAGAGCARAWLIERPDEIDLEALRECAVIGLTSGASTPEESLHAVIDRLAWHFEITIVPVGAPESTSFRAASIAALA